MKKVLFITACLVSYESFAWCTQGDAELNFNRVLASSKINQGINKSLGTGYYSTPGSQMAPPSEKLVTDSRINMQTCLQKNNRNYYCKLKALYGQHQENNHHYGDVLPYIQGLLQRYQGLYASYICPRVTQIARSY